MESIKEYFHNRFILLVFFTLIFILINWFFIGSFFPNPDISNLWFYSGLFMILFSILFIEPYYTSPKNVITNIVPLLLVFLAIKGSFESVISWWFAIVVLLSLLISSIIAIAVEDRNKSPVHFQNRISELLKNLVVLFGQGKVLYSAVFLYFLFTYYSVQDLYTLILLVTWFFILAIDPKKIKSTFATKNKELDETALGEIFGVQSRKIFLVKLFDDRKNIKKFDVVKFRYSMQDSDDFLMSGIIFDTYLLNQEKWTKILQLGKIKKGSTNFEKNIVYKISDTEEANILENDLKVAEFVGIVSRDSNIGKIKFEYSKKDDDLQEGDLVELAIGNRRLFYQIISGITEKEKLENKNETGFIEGEAIQLGEWKNDKLSFQKFGWVPTINTPIFKANTENINIPSFDYPEYKLGVIPNTTLPSVINLHDAISHHMALLGVTGSGKSFLARQIIKELNKDAKVICIDFTGEWKREIEKIKLETEVLTKANIDTFLSDTDSATIGIVELPEMSNTVEIINATSNLLEIIFKFAKAKYDSGSPIRISLVLEEAHTITPESSFLGVNNWDSKAVVNKIGQVALQGRKYGVGLLVIAQRTANVSKTVLTQCNTIVCFQAFDETSFTFLSNYIGKDLVQTLPNLQQYHAIVTGKAIRSNLPTIIDLTREVEKEEVE